MTPPRPPLEGHQHSQPTAVGAVRHLDVPGGNQTMKSFLTQKARGKTSGSNQGSDVAGACCPPPQHSQGLEKTFHLLRLFFLQD